jgi:hypothetical protein
MPNIRSIDEDAALEVQGEDLVFSEGRLVIHPLTKPLAVEFTKLVEDEWLPLVTKQYKLIIDVLRAEGHVWYIDMRLDAFVDKFHPTLLRAVGNNDQDPRYTALMQGKRPFELKRPLLKKQLEIMNKWPKTLVEPAYQSLTELSALLPELQEILAEANTAQQVHEAAKTARVNFRALGERRTFTKTLNALRQSTGGKLGEMVHKLTSETLPTDFPDWFFRPSRRTEYVDERTLDDIDRDIADAENTLQKLKEERAETEQRLANAEKEANERKTNEEKLAAAKKRQADAAAEAAALEALLKK